MAVGSWEPSWKVNWPTLGFLWSDWLEAHACVPGDPDRPFIPVGWQLWCLLNHGRVRRGAVPDEGKNNSQAFHYRRSLIVGPQKSGKSPLGAGFVLVEACGPAEFAGWARSGDSYRCSDYGCGCGFEYVYEAGEPMGRPRPKNLIQLMANSQDQVDNVFDAVYDMAAFGPLSEQVKINFDMLRLPNNGRIDKVTASSKSRLGARISFALGDEAGLYTRDTERTWGTMRRGLAGMGGRSVEITNPWDPMDNSAAQKTYEAHMPDVFIFYRKPPANLDYLNDTDRRAIHEYVYAGSPWVDLDAIEAEAAEIMVRDPTQAMRFYGNMLVQGQGTYLTEAVIDGAERALEVPEGAEVTLGFDGSQTGDWTGFRACWLGPNGERHTFTPTYGEDRVPAVFDPATFPDGRIPYGEVDAAMDSIMRRYRVRLVYADPHLWESQIEAWQVKYSPEIVQAWPTFSVSRMFPALVRYREDMASGRMTHSPDGVYKVHAMNARKVAKTQDRFILGKPAPHMKIDLVMMDVLAYEAAASALMAGLQAKPGRQYEVSTAVFSFS
ncbi:Phage terminase-like protein, large subunit [Actinobaculum suis]|uniref:Phage terminase-like protein, large subunit n=1 Tax=Actinobaculum suis TaxID=1657 RepID=A0A7Z8YBP4_9ACTO|nr:Phage terminase-like protein, large subunit [Actinobaculum suis]